jgi:hypothetical protein
LASLKDWVTAFLFVAAAVFASASTAGTNAWTAVATPDENVTAVAVDPSNPSIIYAGTYQGTFTIVAHIYKSTDSGASWIPLLTLDRAIYSLAVDPQSPSTVYAVGAEILKSIDGGATWNVRNVGLPPGVQSLVMDTATPSTLYAITFRKIYRTTNGAESWSVFLEDVPHCCSFASYRFLVVDPTNSAKIFVSREFSGDLIMSSDGGASWHSAMLGGSTPSSLVVDPAQPANVLAGTNTMMRSSDGGLMWSASGAGLPISPLIGSLHAIPGTPSTIFASVNDTVYASRDAGGFWQLANSGVPIYAATFASSAAAPSVVWAIARSSENEWRLLYVYTHDPAVLGPACQLTATPIVVAEGGSSTLTAQCDSAPTSYVWSANAGLASTASSGVVFPTSTTTYSVQGVNANGAGRTASVTVYAPGPRLHGISTRGSVLTGDNVLIAGFIIDGISDKTVLIRARGPSLAQSGLSGALANPTLRLVGAGTSLAINDDWVSAANAAQIEQTGMAPSDPLESAILMTLHPGSYTAIVESVDRVGGLGIVEVYEVDNFHVPLVGISTRGYVGTGDQQLIGGFAISGDGPQTVVVRARGPSLAFAGIANALQNPVLRVFAGGSLVAANDDWPGDPNASQLQATGFAPTDSRESAILLTLNPGLYTVVVSGQNDTVGLGIVEVFEP